VYVDGLVLRDRDTDSNGTLDERLYALQDANWNTTALVNTTGTVQERYTYTPFGQVTFRDGSGSTLSGSAKDWIFLHQGGERIAAGDYEFRNRVYSPSLGRWLSNDPLGFEAGDQNWYRSIGNNPGNGLDPEGLEEFNYLLGRINFLSSGGNIDGPGGQSNGSNLIFPPPPQFVPNPFDYPPKLPTESLTPLNYGFLLTGELGFGEIVPAKWLDPYKEFGSTFPTLLMGGAPIKSQLNPITLEYQMGMGNPQPGKVIETGFQGYYSGNNLLIQYNTSHSHIQHETQANVAVTYEPNRWANATVATGMNWHHGVEPNFTLSTGLYLKPSLFFENTPYQNYIFENSNLIFKGFYNNFGGYKLNIEYQINF
jgi:RHS repeat-associated protein